MCIIAIMVCIGSYAQEDSHLQTLTKRLLQVRKAKASEKALNKAVIAWSAQGMPKITLMDEIGYDSRNELRNNGKNSFKMNQLVTFVYHRQNTGMVSKGDYFNSTEKGIFYSAIEKTVKAGCTTTYTLTGHAGEQEFVFVAFDPKAKFTAIVDGLTASDAGEGVKTLKTKRKGKDDKIVFAITNSSTEPQSFVILNHNPQK